MTYDEACQTMAQKCPYKTADQWSDFFSMSQDLQKTEAQLVKDAVFQAPNSHSIWSDMLGFLGVAANVFGETSGIASAFEVFSSFKL